jgi:hypothetical protein
MNLIETDSLVYSLKLSTGGNPVTEYSPVVFAGEPDTYPRLEITVTNTGNRQLTGLQLKEKGNAGNFDIGFLSPGALEPNESVSFPVVFTPVDPSKPGVYSVEILASADNASKVMKLEYTSYVLADLEPGKVITLTPPVLQMGKTSSAGVTTDDTGKTTGGPWLSSNPDVAYFDEGSPDELIVTGPGETMIYFVTGAPEDYTVKGRKITVYPAIETLNPVYPLEGGFVTGVDGGAPVLPANLTAITIAADVGDDIDFILTPDDSGHLSLNSDTGALTFSGNVGYEIKATVDLTITKTILEGLLITHKGSVAFTARIVPSKPGPKIQSAVIDGANRADAKKLVITYDKAFMLTSLDGFSIGGASQGAFVFSGHGVSGNTLTITLGREPAWSEIQAASLTLTYTAGMGNVKDADGAPGITASGFPVTIQNFGEAVYEPPKVIAADGIVLDGNFPTSLVIIWNKDLDVSSSYAGFTLAGAPGITFTAAAVKNAALILTMNRAPSKTEAQGTLTLSYNLSNSSPVKDKSGNAAESFSNKTVTVTNAELFLAPPELVSAVIDAASSKTLTLTFDQAVDASSSAGFSISGSATATSIVLSVSGTGTTTLALTLNRKPAYGETLLLSYNSASGNVARHNNSAVVLASFSNQAVTLTGFSDTNDSRPNMVSVVIDADSNGDLTPTTAEAKTIYVTYNKAVKAANYNGFTVTGSKTALTITGISGSGTDTLALALDDWPSASEKGAFTLSYSMELGNVCDNANSDNLALSFSKEVKFENYDSLGENVDTAPPRLVSATVENSSPTTMRVVFNEPVIVDHAKFIVKVNKAVPRVVMSSPTNGILMDIQKEAADRTISAAVPVGGTNNKTWDMTMSAAAHGEILRLASTDSGAATDPAGNALPVILQFIVNNKVKRVRNAFESTPGLYKNGTLITAVTNGDGDDMYQNAMQYLTKSQSFSGTGVIPSPNDVYILVLDTNQTITTSPTWWGYAAGSGLAAAHAQNGGSWYIITTPPGTYNDITITNAGTGAAFQGRNGTVLVIEDHVVFEQKAGTSIANALVQMMDGGSIILDGGAIQNNVNQRNTTAAGQNNDLFAGGIRFGGGSYAGYLIINSGKITNNTARFGITPNGETNGAAGGIITQQYGVIVMNGGEISNNTLDVAGFTPKTALAGGVMGSTDTAQHHANLSFFMTGGEIFGNRVIGSTAAVASAGGVMASGTFQKNGGTIYGADSGDASKHNTTSLTGNKASAVYVSGAAGSNPSGSGTVKREDTADPGVTLFVESIKTSTSAKGQNTVPTWATSFWDE